MEQLQQLPVERCPSGPMLLIDNPTSSGVVDYMQHGIEPPVFVIGAGRSGTTVFVDLLGEHTDVSPCYETEFITQVMTQLFRAGITVGFFCEAFKKILDDWYYLLRKDEKGDHEKFSHSFNYFLPSKEFLDQEVERFLGKVKSNGGKVAGPFRDFFLRLLSEHSKLDGNKPIVVNKTPSYSHVVARLAALFPGSKVIHIVRDGRAVANSVIPRPFGPYTITEAAAWWADRIEMATMFGKANPTRFMQVRYEILVTSPRETLEEAFRWIGAKSGQAEVFLQDGADGFSYAGGRHKVHRDRIFKWKGCHNYALFQAQERVSALLRKYGSERYEEDVSIQRSACFGGA